MNKGRVKLYLLQFLVFLFYGTSALSQSEFGGFELIDKEDGLFHISIKTLCEDSKGYMWVGSSDGLMRSDGIYYDVFRKTNSTSSELSDNTINCILEDANQYVFWVGTKVGGISKFNLYSKENAHYYIEPDLASNTGFVHINAICQIGRNKFLVGTEEQGLYYFYPSQNRFEKFESIFKTANEFPKLIHRIIKSKNFIWVTTSKGLIQFNLEGQFLDNYFFNGNSFVESIDNTSQDVMDIIEKDDDNIVFTSGNILYSFNWQSNTITKLFVANKSVKLNFLVCDKKDGYWIGSENNGVYYFCENTEEYICYNRQNSKGTIPCNRIEDIEICQNSSIVWIATRMGLVKYDYHKSKFKQFDLIDLTKGEIDEPYTLVKDSKGGYWVRSKFALYHKKQEDKYFKVVDFSEKFIAFRFIEDQKAFLWGVTNIGLLKYNLETDAYSLLHFKFKDIGLDKINYLTAITQVVDNKVWIITKIGLIHFDVFTEQYKVYPLGEDYIDKLNYRFTSIDYSLDKKYLWIGNRRGELFKFDIKNKEYSSVDIRQNINEQKPCIILDLKVDNDDKVWMATYGIGVLIYDPNTGVVSKDMAVGMLESYAYGIVKDNNSDFWISSNLGISKVNTQTLKITNFDSSDGTFCNEFNDLAHYKAPDGNILFGGMNGFIELNPDCIYMNHYKPKVYLSSYLINNKITYYGDKIFEDVIYLCDSVITISSDSKITMYASVLNYSNSDDNKIKWKLHGVDDEWREGYSYGSINYEKLDGGNYLLTLKGTNADGFEGEAEVNVMISVSVPFYYSNWFKVLLFVFIGVVIVIIIRIRALWHQHQSKLLKGKVEDQTKELRITNDKLERSKEEIFTQKTELEIHRNYLEDIVSVRTADLKQAKIKAEESDKLKTAFLANLSHEIRTPMNAIIGFSTLLQTGEFENDQKNDFLNVINKSSESLLALIDDIIDISRIETGNIEMKIKETHLPSLVKEITDELVFEEKSHRVRFLQAYELVSDDSSIFTDHYRLKQIISNLLRNAFKFTAEGFVKLTIKSSSADMLTHAGFTVDKQRVEYFNPILFTIEDSGIGIKEEDLRLIFEPFQKANNECKFYKGMGLGLSIVKSLIVLFGGDIQVMSTPSKGTKFTFYINSFREFSQRQN